MSPRRVAWAIIKTIFAVVIAAVIMMLVYRFALEAYDFGYRIFAEDPVSPEPGLTMSVAIVEGKSAMDIGKILEEKGLVRNAWLFYLQEFFSSYHKDLQPGIYELNTAMTPEEMMAVMSSNSGRSEEDEEEEVSGNSEASTELMGDDSNGSSEEGGGEGADAAPEAQE